MSVAAVRQGFELTHGVNGVHGASGVQDTLSHCMKDYKHGPNSRMSITFNSSKGLTNAPGQNNCFLNSAVQVLWHLDAFRRSFRLLSGHSCMGNACIFCALKVMFTQFQYSDKQVLPPDALRQALSETFENQQRFQMGFMDDAAECFENILTRIHTHIACGEDEDTCSAPHCIPHRKFSMSVSEQVVCGSCSARSEPFTFNEMVFYVSTGALVTEFKSHSSQERARLSFSQLLKSTVSKGDIRSCPDNCGEFGEKRRNLTNFPDVVSIGLVWESAKSGSQHIRDVVNCIGTSLNLTELFHSTPYDNVAGGCAPPQHLQLVGVVCYYGKHYSTFFFHSKVHEWIYFDDASVKQISPSWSKVCEKLCKGRHQPLLLLYMNPNTEAVDDSLAPKYRTMAQGYGWKSEELNESINGRSKTPVPEPESHVNSSRGAFSSGPERLDSGYDEVDSAYVSRHYYGGGREKRRADRQFSGSSALSRQDSGVSSQSSRSHPAVECDSVSGISTALTQHSSDSGSSGHQLSRQESDTASSYCSRSSRASTVSTFSSAVESEDTGYVGLDHDDISSPQKRDKPKVSLKKKKMKNRLDAADVRYHSKSQTSLLDVHNQSYDDSSLHRDSHIDATDQKSFSYATLPRKKRATPATQQPVTPVKSPEAIDAGRCPTSSADKDGEMSINSRIQMFNNIDDQSKISHPSNASSNRPPELKPLLQINGHSGRDGESPSYISRSSVEKILNQQRKASSRSAMKLMRPTYEEQFSLPEEFASIGLTAENKARFESRNGADNTSLSSLKDSGYRSLGDRGSNSASSVSSLSAESPTVNHSFTFDTREPIYCEPPPISSESDHINEAEEFGGLAGEDEYDFPPPPPELLGANSNHMKQLSEASLLSEASTLRHRKTPSIESLDGLPTIDAAVNGTADAVREPLSSLSQSDLKLKAQLKSADDFINNSVEREERRELNTALAFCRQASSLLSSILNQRPDDIQLEMLIQSKHEFCQNRTKVLLARIAEDDGRGDSQSDTRHSSGGRHVMGELHIDNQTKREHASSDYTPLHNAIHRAPVRDGAVAPHVPSHPHRLSRTDSQMSSGSNSSSTTHSIRTMTSNPAHRPPSSPTVLEPNASSERTLHTVPPRLQQSISQLQQKQHSEQLQQKQSEQLQERNAYHIPEESHHQQLNYPKHYHSQQLQSQQNNIKQEQHINQQLHQNPPRQPYTRHHSVPTAHPGILEASKASAHAKPPVNSLYREVNIPTTLQRNDYIRDGCKAVERPPPADRRACPSPSVIPPPKEFQESYSPAIVSRNSPVSSDSCSNSVRGGASYQPTPPAKLNSKYNGAQSNGYYPTHSNQAASVAPHGQSYSRSISTPSTSSHEAPRDVIDLPPKHNINKHNIREILVKDMLKRKGHHAMPSGGQLIEPKNVTYQPPHPAHHGSAHPAPYGSAHPAPYSSAHGAQANPTSYSSSYAPQANVAPYSSRFEEPLWTPPQQSAYDRGLSHYDKPNYHRQNLYGQVNGQSATNTRYPPTNQTQQSLYGESVPTDSRRPARRSVGAPEASRINHCHTYSTEL